MKYCRSCEEELSKPFLNLGNSPISNNYLKEEDIHKPEIYYPLEVYYCQNCHLVQIDNFETPENIFNSKYAYFSSHSSSWLKHCKEYVDETVKRFGLNSDSLVLEIGSNDGYLLQYFKNYNIPVRGIEPSTATANVAIEKGIPTDKVFFNVNYANENPECADLIIGNNVIAHNPHLHTFVEGMRRALKPDGIITIEFPSIMELIKNNQFDTIYQEHYSYFSLHSIKYLFKMHHLEIFDAVKLPTHGGSLRIYARHKGKIGSNESFRISILLNEEKEFGLLEEKTYKTFNDYVEDAKWSLLIKLIHLKSAECSIVGYGAPAKGNTLLNYCGIRTDFIDYTVDVNQHKQGLFLPGTHIPIKHPDQIKTDKPDYVLILPWNIKDEIVEQLSYIREWGGKFIIPIPSMEIL